MRLLKAGVVLLAGASMLVSASPALAALPDVHLLSGEEYPASGSGSIEEGGNVVGKLETAIGEKLTFTKAAIFNELLELSSLGPNSLVLTGVLEAKKKVPCHSEGRAEGEVLIEGEYHVVTAVGGSQALLVLFKELLVLCNSGLLKVKVRAPVLIHLNVTAGEDVTSYGISAKCAGKGKQDLTQYLNDSQAPTSGQLTANFGLGFEVACLEFLKEMTISSSKMVDFLF